MTEPKVSVIIPVYNTEKYLRQCLDSVCGQTLEEIEIICVDDGSTDSSAEILEEYRAQDARVEVITQKNAGAGAARNNALKRARGEYLSFLDADDFFELDKLEQEYNQAIAAKADIVISLADKFHEDTQEFQEDKCITNTASMPPYQPFKYRQLTENVFKSIRGWAWDKLFRREFVEEQQLSFQEQRTSNDLLFVYSAIVSAERMALVDAVLSHQRDQLGGSLSSTREKSWDCCYHAMMALKEFLIRTGRFEELEKDYASYALNFILWNYTTLVGPAKEKLDRNLREQWWAELCVADRPSFYFDSPADFKIYDEIFL